MTMITGKVMMDRFQIANVRAHCRLMAAGMTHTKLTKTRVLELAGEITGKTYKRGQHAQAAEDITEILDTVKYLVPSAGDFIVCDKDGVYRVEKAK